MTYQFFVIKIHHGGTFTESGYVGGMTHFERDVDPDLMSYFEILGLVKEIGYPITTVIWFRRPYETEFRLINDDSCVLEIFKLYAAANLFEIDLYTQSVNIDLEHVGSDDLGVRNGDIVVGIDDLEDDKLLEDENGDSEGDYIDISDPNYEASTESDEDNLSEFDFFAEGDRLSDTCDAVDDEEVDINQTNEVLEVQSDHAFHTDEKNVQSDPENLSEPNDSGEEYAGEKFPEFDEESEIKNPKLEVGLVFANSTIYRKALRQYSVKRGFELKFEKNEKRRVTACCKKKCGWRIHASLMGKSTAFQIKSLKGEPHSCPRIFENKSANSSYLAHQYLDTFMEDPTMPIKSFRNLVRKEVKVYAHRQKLYRAKRKAIEMIQGNVHEQYSRMRQYCHEILKTNPGSTVVLKVQGPPLYRNPKFQRIFVLFDAMKRGFIEGCRPIIGLDGCFLKGPFGGQLMAAIGRDGNNQMFPLAFAVVESECRESWSWFLELLNGSFGNVDLTNYTFISDRQKGLVESFQNIMPSTEHRFCVRHLYANFKLKFKDKALKDLMWSAARSYLEDGFNKKMSELRAISNEAYEWLMKIPTHQWCKHMMSTSPKCDMLSNNLCESFNNYIKEAREMPILTMMEALRRQFMCRIHTKREWIEKCKGKICPRIQEKLNMIKEKALDFECYMAAEGLWEVSLGKKSWVVDLRRYSCSCREWDMTGIPCHHATCAILQEKKDAEDFVSNYYSVDMYKTAYKYIITPVPDHSQWSPLSAHEQEQRIMPPPFKKLTGRPRKMRKKGLDEINVGGKVTRKGTVFACSNCGDITHNKRRCKKPPPEQPRKKKQTTSIPHVGVAAVGPQSRPSTSIASAHAVQVSRFANAIPSSTSVGRGLGTRKKGNNNRVGNRRGNPYGPQSGIGNWNGIGMLNEFRPPIKGRAKNTSHVERNSNIGNIEDRANNRSHVESDSNPGNIEIQVHNTRFGPVLFSSQSSNSKRFNVVTDIGES